MTVLHTVTVYQWSACENDFNVFQPSSSLKIIVSGKKH